jgi:amino acid permease
MMYLMMQALAELAVMYPINGAFTMYICRFIDPSWGFACGWQYAISWLTVLPFEISAACNIIHYWPGSDGINNAAWITPLLAGLVFIQFFGVKGYGEVSAPSFIACCYRMKRIDTFEIGRICTVDHQSHSLLGLHDSGYHHQHGRRAN